MKHLKPFSKSNYEEIDEINISDDDRVEFSNYDRQTIKSFFSKFDTGGYDPYEIFLRTDNHGEYIHIEVWNGAASFDLFIYKATDSYFYVKLIHKASEEEELYICNDIIGLKDYLRDNIHFF